MESSVKRRPNKKAEDCNSDDETRREMSQNSTTIEHSNNSNTHNNHQITLNDKECCMELDDEEVLLGDKCLETSDDDDKDDNNTDADCDCDGDGDGVHAIIRTDRKQARSRTFDETDKTAMRLFPSSPPPSSHQSFSLSPSSRPTSYTNNNYTSRTSKAINSSFDASLLSQTTKTPRLNRNAASCDEKDSAHNDVVTQKSPLQQNLQFQQQQHNIQLHHLLQQQHQQPQVPHLSIEMPDLGLGPSRSGRKAALSSTPVRPRFKPASAQLTSKKTKLTPAKRQKTPHLQRRSPLRVIPKTPRDSLSARSRNDSSNSLNAILSASAISNAAAIRAESPAPEQHYNALLAFSHDSADNNPTSQIHNDYHVHSDYYSKIAFAPTAVKATRKPKSSFGTHTTAASTNFLETTCDSMDSAETDNHSSAPFRFTSFPASLPRVHDRPPTDDSNNLLASACPGTVRKRMSFAECLNKSNNDDGTNNTSFSSLLDYGASDEEEDDDDEDENDLFRHQKFRRHHHFNHQEELRHNENRHEDVDHSAKGESPAAARTRLNFSSVLSPEFVPNAPYKSQFVNENTQQGDVAPLEDAKIDLFRPYEQNRINSFASSVSSLTTAKNLSGFADDFAGGNPSELGNKTPSRGGSDHADLMQVRDGPGTPKEVQFHFQLDAAQCSPIPGIPEEDGDVSSKSVFSMRRNRDTAVTRLCTSRDSSSKSSQTGSRPMPDMAAFDPDISHHTSRSEESSSPGQQCPSSPKLLCPPTPVRTPAWAHTNESTVNSVFKPNAKYSRSNSLIATKVLATCPRQVLDGRASLENSALEDDGSLNTSGETFSGNSSSLPPPPPAPPSSWASSIHGPTTSENYSSVIRDHATRPPLMPPHNAGTVPPVISMTTHFEVLSRLGQGAFADVFKVRSKVDGRLYAVKRNRRQFRGKRDREKAMAEVKCMQHLQSVCADAAYAHSNFCLYLLFFFQAWQEEGHFFSQTELCCRDTCRHVMDTIRLHWTRSRSLYPCLRRLEVATDPSCLSGDGRLFPESTIWKICHDMSAGLSHIHARGYVHFDIKPANIFFVSHARLGAMCKIGDFGLAGEIGSSEDGQEGDQKYMAPELLSSDKKNPSADMFSLGLTLYELISSLSFTLPCEGGRWQELRSGRHKLDAPPGRDPDLLDLIQSFLHPNPEHRPTAKSILSISKVAAAGSSCDSFLRDYIQDIEILDNRKAEELRLAVAVAASNPFGTGGGPTCLATPRMHHSSKSAASVGRACSPSIHQAAAGCFYTTDAATGVVVAAPPLIYSPEVAPS